MAGYGALLGAMNPQQTYSTGRKSKRQGRRPMRQAKRG